MDTSSGSDTISLVILAVVPIAVLAVSASFCVCSPREFDLSAALSSDTGVGDVDPDFGWAFLLLVVNERRLG